MLRKKTTLTLFIVIISAATLFVADRRKVQLQYVANIKIFPEKLAYTGDRPPVFPIPGSVLKNIISESIQPRTGSNQEEVLERDQKEYLAQYDYINDIQK